jgi:hypothetical protein
MNANQLLELFVATLLSALGWLVTGRVRGNEKALEKLDTRLRVAESRFSDCPTRQELNDEVKEMRTEIMQMLLHISNKMDNKVDK